MKDIFANVNDWLRFAEAKNGALVAFDAAVAFGALSLGIGAQGLATWLAVVMVVSAILALISASVALFTFLPKLTSDLLAQEEPPSPTDNLLFYGHIAKYTPDSYLEALRTRLRLSQDISPYAEQLAEQIVINAQIASWKYQLFNKALWFALFALLMPLLTAFVVFVTRI